jgi:hypothetical protein
VPYGSSSHQERTLLDSSGIHHCQVGCRQGGASLFNIVRFLWGPAHKEQAPAGEDVVRAGARRWALYRAGLA